MAAPMVFVKNLVPVLTNLRLKSCRRLFSSSMLTSSMRNADTHASSLKCLSRNSLMDISLRNSILVNSSICWISQSNHQCYRKFSQSTKNKEDLIRKSTLFYLAAVGIAMVGMSFAAVPLYRMFCSTTGRGGQALVNADIDKVENMEPIKDRLLTIRFNADTVASMQWNFRPQQVEIKVLPGETALAFYTAKNPTDKPIIGISTYNVIPFEAGQYFNKIQCFCFEEQRLNPHEQVDMPVFFYIDPEYVDDPRLENIDLVTLSYTFFEAKDGMSLPLPGYTQSQPQPATS